MPSSGEHGPSAAPTPRAARRRVARALGRRTVAGPQTVEAYLRGQTMPRYMQRLREIETEYLVQRGRLESTYLELAEDCGPDAEAFATRWRATARAWRFDSLNELIQEHNAWYPIEAGLPMDPRSRDYVPIRGASYRRLELGPEWVLEQLPPRSGAATPRLPRRAPREPLQ